MFFDIKCSECGRQKWGKNTRIKTCGYKCKLIRHARLEREKRANAPVPVPVKAVPKVAGRKQHIPTMAPPLRGSVAAMVMGGMVCR